MTLCIWAIDFLSLGVGSVLAVLFGAIVLSVSDAMAYEYARKEFATGKTMTFAVKSGYKKCFWHIFDMHIVLAALGFIAYFIALTTTFGVRLHARHCHVLLGACDAGGRPLLLVHHDAVCKRQGKVLPLP